MLSLPFRCLLSALEVYLCFWKRRWILLNDLFLFWRNRRLLSHWHYSARFLWVLMLSVFPLTLSGFIGRFCLVLVKPLLKVFFQLLDSFFNVINALLLFIWLFSQRLEFFGFVLEIQWIIIRILTFWTALTLIPPLLILFRMIRIRLLIWLRVRVRVLTLLVWWVHFGWLLLVFGIRVWWLALAGFPLFFDNIVCSLIHFCPHLSRFL